MESCTHPSSRLAAFFGGMLWLQGSTPVQAGAHQAFVHGLSCTPSANVMLQLPRGTVITYAKDSNREEGKRKRDEDRSKLEALMAKQEREAVKKYLTEQAKKDAESAARMKANATPPKGARREAPWLKGQPQQGGEDGGKGGTKGAAAGRAAQGRPAAPPSKPKKRPNIFQQVTMTSRHFSIDDIKDMTFEGGYTDEVPFFGLPEVAVFGRSNVGKSSLLNSLAGANSNRVAVVGKTPGRTQQINLFKVHDSSGPVGMIVDLPGYGYAKLPKAVQQDIGMQVRQFLSDRPTLTLAILLLDSRREPQRSDLNMIKYFRGANVPLLVLATKVDKLKMEEIDINLDRLQTFFKLPEGQPLPFSAITGLNTRSVWSAIRDAYVGEYLTVGRDGVTPAEP